MSSRINVSAEFIRFDETVLNKADIAEANLKTGEIRMRSGNVYTVPSEALYGFFSELYDVKKLYATEHVCKECRYYDHKNNHHCNFHDSLTHPAYACAHYKCRVLAAKGGAE